MLRQFLRLFMALAVITTPAHAKTTWLSCSVARVAGNAPTTTFTFAFDDIEQTASMMLSNMSFSGRVSIAPTTISADFGDYRIGLDRVDGKVSLSGFREQTATGTSQGTCIATDSPTKF